MIYVKVTPNRPDALGVHGIARDLAARGFGRPRATRNRTSLTEFQIAYRGRTALASW